MVDNSAEKVDVVIYVRDLCDWQAFVALSDNSRINWLLSLIASMSRLVHSLDKFLTLRKDELPRLFLNIVHVSLVRHIKRLLLKPSLTVLHDSAIACCRMRF